jgi:hypothetical protein
LIRVRVLSPLDVSFVAGGGCFAEGDRSPIYGVVGLTMRVAEWTWAFGELSMT